ncbi:MAG: hypothetical protein U0872_06765 [Planctomycetaceae bacterium]
MQRRHFGWAILGLSLMAHGLSAEDKPQPTEAEKQAIAAIKKLGGNVMEIAQNDARLDVAFHLADSKIGDEQLALVKNLPRTTILNLRGTDITDAGLANLKDLKGLTKLHLEKTKITDAGLEHLKGLENLEYLNLYGTQVTDAGLKQLEGLKKLKKLYPYGKRPSPTPASPALKATLPRALELPKPEPKPEEKKPEEKK